MCVRERGRGSGACNASARGDLWSVRVEIVITDGVLENRGKYGAQQ